MNGYLIRLGLAGLLLTAVPVHLPAQNPDQLDEFRRNRRMESSLDFWNAVRFELDIGKPDIAARYLRGLIERKPSARDLHAILDKDGMTPILQLRNVQVWSGNKKDQDQAKKDTEALIDSVIRANQARLTSEDRLRQLIHQLDETPEERIFAIRELYKSGAQAIPLMLQMFQQAKDPAKRQAISQALYKMGPSSVAPLVAALDSDDPQLKMEVLNVLHRSHVKQASQITPFLWFPSADRSEDPTVRTKASTMLAEFLNVPADRLTTPKAALTREAERFFQHKADFGDPKAVSVWRWDNGKVTQGWPNTPTIPASQAEQYYGQKFARQALALDPEYRPAQMVSLSLAVDKALEQAGPGASLERVSPQVAGLLDRADVDLLMDLADRSLKEGRNPVALAAIRALGQRAEVRAKKPLSGTESVLTRALYHPDTRIQMAAADAILRIPGPPPPKTATRIVDILSRALSPAAAVIPGRKVLVGLSDEGLRDRVRQILLTVGIQPVAVTNGKDAMRALRATSEIEGIIIDSTLPYPGLANLLAQIKQDVDVGQLPVLLAAIPETHTARMASAHFNELRGRVQGILRDTEKYQSLLRDMQANEDREKKNFEQEMNAIRRLTTQERETAFARIDKKYQSLREKAAQDFPGAAYLSREIPRLQQQIAQEVEIYDLESRVREASLARFVSRYPLVQVVNTSMLTDAQGIEYSLGDNIRRALAQVPLSEAEKKDVADRAMEWLANLSEGKPAGYDIRPAADRILDVVREGRLSPSGQKAGLRAAAHLEGERVQKVLATAILDGKRDAETRKAAIQAMIQNLQRQGPLLPRSDVDSLRELAGKPGTDPALRDQTNLLLGALRPTSRETGESLRQFRPGPQAPLPKPKAEAPPAEKKP